MISKQLHPAAAGACALGGRHAESKSMGPERVTGRARPTRTRCATPARADAAAAHTACYRNAFDAQTALQRRHIRKRVARKPAKGPLSNRRFSRIRPFIASGLKSAGWFCRASGFVLCRLCERAAVQANPRAVVGNRRLGMTRTEMTVLPLSSRACWTCKGTDFCLPTFS